MVKVPTKCIASADLDATRPLAQILLVFGRANTGKTEVVRAFNEFCLEQKVEVTLVDLDSQKMRIGSLGALYGDDLVRRMGHALDGADIAEFFWPIVIEAGKSGRSVIIDCAGSDPRMLDFAFKFNLEHLATYYKVEIIPCFVVSADEADWQYIEKIEERHPLGGRKLLIFNEKFTTRAGNVGNQWERFKELQVVKNLASSGARFAAIPREDQIQEVSRRPVHRGLLGQDNAESLALEPYVALWRQTLIAAWYRQFQAEFPSDGIRLPWHV